VLLVERDAARQQLADGRASVPGAINALSQQQIWALFPAMAARYTFQVWSTSYFRNGTDYALPCDLHVVRLLRG
jgi:hypothetical protein